MIVLYDLYLHFYPAVLRFFQGYIEFFLYDGNYQSVFSCAMTLNVFAMVRVLGLVAKVVKLERSIDRAVLLGGLCNFSFIGGHFMAVLFIFCLLTWNFWFSVIKVIEHYFMIFGCTYWGKQNFPFSSVPC